MTLPVFRSLIPLADLLPGRLGSSVRAALAQARTDPDGAAAVLLRDVSISPVLDRGWLPCLHHDGHGCPECRGGPSPGYLTAPTDAASWSVRAHRARFWAARTLVVHERRTLHEQAAHAWVRVVELTTGPARTQAIDSAVRDFREAGQPEEARALVVEYAADAGEWALARTGKVGRKIASRRHAVELSEARKQAARLGPTLHMIELDEVES